MTKSETTGGGLQFRTLETRDGNDLLSRRIAAYYAGESQTSVSSSPADDVMKELVRDNFIDNADYSGTPTNSRSISGSGFSVESDTSEGGNITKGFSWRNVLDTLVDIQAESRSAGTEVFFAVIDTSESTEKFVTSTGQLGADRTSQFGFSLSYGNLYNPSLETDASFENNVVYSGGQGDGKTRIVATAEDEAKSLAGGFSRNETFLQSNGRTSAAVQSDANGELVRGRSSIIFSGDVLDSPSFRYGVDWDFGDKVPVYYSGLSFDALVTAVNITIDSVGRETIKARIENVG